MTHCQLTHKNLLILVTCMVTVCILTMGMRGPETSRGKGTKSPRRAVIEKEVKKSPQQAIKKQLELEAVPVRQAGPPAPATRRLHAVATAPAKGFPAPGPIPSRAPPVLPA